MAPIRTRVGIPARPISENTRTGQAGERRTTRIRARAARCGLWPAPSRVWGPKNGRECLLRSALQVPGRLQTPCRLELLDEPLDNEQVVHRIWHLVIIGF